MDNIAQGQGKSVELWNCKEKMQALQESIDKETRQLQQAVAEQLASQDKIFQERLGRVAERTNLVIDNLSEQATKALDSIQTSLSAGSVRMADLTTAIVGTAEEMNQRLTTELADAVDELEAKIKDEVSDLRTNDLATLKTEITKIADRPMNLIKACSPFLVALIGAGIFMWVEVHKIDRLAASINELQTFKEQTLRWEGKIDAHVGTRE